MTASRVGCSHGEVKMSGEGRLEVQTTSSVEAVGKTEALSLTSVHFREDP